MSVNRKARVLYSCSWTFAGASLAMITPDLIYGWPDPNYIMYMITHGLLLLGALYFTVVEGLRPPVPDIWRVLKVSLYVMLVIFPLNYIIDGGANYF
ncbi:MAG: YwaF family protein [Candidatus Marinimicrobia bacterium]|nr:YwaF family protein [Candidatus Neomarinimicrobiota bacterium]